MTSPPEKQDSEDSPRMNEVGIRLSNPFVPCGYELCIVANLDHWTYEGTECIRLERDRSVSLRSLITLHVANTIKVSKVKGGSILSQDSSKDTITFQLSDELVEKGEAGEEINLMIEFSHEMQEELHGFYRVKYLHEKKECRMASTHFEPTSARRFFICQDEPAARASFLLTVRIPAASTHAAKLTVLSNSPLQHKWEEGGYIHHEFDPIHQCPPYLLACVIGELECISTVAGSSKIPISVYSTPGKISRASFALKITAFALEFFEMFFQYPFPLPKLDVVAVPDFPIGGMENWGCICCIETILLHDDASSSVEAKERVAELLCHEVSHNWFGNLVGIDWWEGLWLKEGFASWCGYYAANAFRPSWCCLDSGLLSVTRAKTIDQYDNSHPVEVPVSDPSNITEIFDRISYDKGMGLVWMLESFLGEKWSLAVAYYIRKFAFKATKTNQLWEALEEFSGEQIASSMKTFTTHLGFPLVHVARKDSNTLTIRQERCLLATNSRKNGASAGALWSIPLTLSSGVQLKKVMLGEEGPQSIAASVKDFPYVIANFQARGFYRVRYDYELFQLLLEKDRYLTLTTMDRCALLSDLTASIFMGFPDLQRFGALCSVTRTHETETVVLKEFVASVMSITAALKGNPDVMRSLRLQQLSFMISVAESYCTIEGAKEPGEDPRLEMHHTFIIQTSLNLIMGCYKTSEALASPLVQWALKQAKHFLRTQKGESLPYRAGTIGVCLAVYSQLDPFTTPAERHAALFEILLSGDLKEKFTRDVLTGLCASTHPPFVEELLIQCTLNNQVRSQYGETLFMAASRNPSFQQNQLWMFFCKNYESIREQWGEGQFRIQTIVEHVGDSLYGEESAEEFENFFAKHPLKKAQMAIKRTVERIRILSFIGSRWTPEEFWKALSTNTA